MKKILLVFIIYIIISGRLYAREAELEANFTLLNIDHETVPVENGFPLPSFEKQRKPFINLEGIWKKERFKADDEITLMRRDKTGYEALVKEAEGREREDYNDASWENKYLPSVENKMNEYQKRPEYYEDGLWYRRSFNVSKSFKGERAIIKFHSVNYVADVWINGSYAGYHEGGYTPFAFDITPFVRFGEKNIIAVRVDNPEWGKRKDIVPFTKVDWFNYTGIIHDVYIEFLPSVSISRVDIVPKSMEGDVDLKFVIWNPEKKDSKVKVAFSIYKACVTEKNILSECASELAGLPVNVQGSSEMDLSFKGETVKAGLNKIKIENPLLWSPEKPFLYILKAVLTSDGHIVDEFYTQFGIRILETKGNKFLLNKKPSFFPSVARHEDHPLYGRAIPKNIIYSDLVLIKNLHTRMVRTGHYPNNLFTYILSDRLGLAIIEEIPVWWFDSEDEWKIQNERRHIHEQMWREMIFRDYNRPSIFLWSACNECLDVKNRKIFIEKIHKDLDGMYPDGRFVTQSAAADRPGPHDDSQFSVDVPGWTMYYGIFYGKDPYKETRKFLHDIQRIHPDKPVLDTEYGRWSREDHKEQDLQIKIFNETFRAFSESASIKEDGAVNEHGGLMAATWWCVFDWYTSSIPDGFQSMGLYQMDRKTSKKVSPLLREKYFIYHPVK